jgi:hypothetical protein
MIVSSKPNFKLYFLLITLIIISCQKKNHEKILEKNTVQIISYLIDAQLDGTINFPTFPPAPANGDYSFSTKDSLKIYKYFYKETIRQKTIVVEQTFFNLKEEEINFKGNCPIDMSKLLSESYKLKEVINKIDVKKLTSRSNNIIISNKNNLSKDFRNVDLIINFSKIIFDKNFNRAIIKVGVATGKLSGYSTLFYLEKENYHWVIKCEKNLSIS